MTVAPLLDLGAVRLAAAIRAREASCREVMSAHLDQIARLNGAVNAIVALRDGDALLAEADAADAALAAGAEVGPLHGLPQAIKDLADTRGLVTTYGSPLFADHVPDADALVVERMRAAGAIVIGKTNVPEWGLGSHTFNPVYGPTRNAYDPTRTAGGSSGGAAVALALRLLPVADGSDMGGSLRNPAAFNNVFGLRPSQGRVPSLGEDVWFDQLGTEGPMGRSVADLALLLSVQAGPDPRAPLALGDDPTVFREPLLGDVAGLRIAWLGDWDGHLATEPGVLELCVGALDELERLGCRVDAVAPPFPPERIWRTWLVLRQWLVGSGLRPLVDDPATRDRVKPEARWEVDEARGLAAADPLAASAERTAWHAALLGLFGRYDLVAAPVAQVFPFPVEWRYPEKIAGRAMDTYHRWMETTFPWTLAGCPAISVPAGFSPTGLPMGLQLVAPPRADLALLRAARAYEEATQWVERCPPPLLNRLGRPAGHRRRRQVGSTRSKGGPPQWVVFSWIGWRRSIRTGSAR